MSVLTATPSALSPEVAEFAAAVGALPHLAGILDLARECFPGGPVAAFVEADAEVADVRHIVVEVDVSRWDADQILEGQAAWSSGLFDVCPAPLTAYVQLGWR